MKTSHFIKITGLILVATLFSGCDWFGKDNSNQQAVNDDSVVQTEQNTEQDQNNDDELAQDTTLSNPATVYCLAQGGEFTMNKTLNGNMAGYCRLPNNVTCEIWAFYKGECPEGAKDEIQPEDNNEPEISTSTEEILEEDIAINTSTSPIMDDESEDVPVIKDDETKTDKPDDSKQNSTTSNNDFDVSIEPGEEAGELYMSWKTDLEPEDGFIVMLSGSDDITYPTKYFHKLENQYSHAFTWIDLTPGKTYYFRVCTVKNDECDVYSPVISGTVAESEQN